MNNNLKLSLHNLSISTIDSHKESKSSKDDKIKKKLYDLLNKQKVNHIYEIKKQKNLKYAHIYCKINNLSGQITGPLLEKYIIDKYNMKKHKSTDCLGDCKKNNQNIEIKCSLGSESHQDFNYVQIRLNHDIHIYILTAYFIDNTNLHNLGELFIFYIPKNEMISLINQFGKYAHGTIKENGIITNSINIQKEYALRPKYNDPCWKKLLAFRIEDISI
jgi:hypothetical protein